MYRVFRPLKDCYITDRVIRNHRVNSANTGQAGSLDLFKLYGVTTTGSVPNNELSRILLKFDLSDLRSEIANGTIDLANSSLNCTLKLFDVYGGQPTPSNFTAKLYPLSRSFDEGLGRDVVFYQDSDVCNFLTASYISGSANIWFASGANSKGFLGSTNIDVISSGNLGAGTVNLWKTQTFAKGTENLEIDVTQIVSATLANLLPDEGFRISFDESQENDTLTRFVKRFGSSQAADPYVQPQLIFKYRDAIVSNENNFTFDSPGTLFLYNTVRGNLANVVSGSSLIPITGTNCMLLKLVTPISTSNGFTTYTTYVTASQHKIGNTNVVGIYSASFTLLSSDAQYSRKIAQSGSVSFDQVWSSFDQTVSYFSGTLSVTPPAGATGPLTPKRYYINVTNIATEYVVTDVSRIKVFVFDYSNPVVKLVRMPLETPSVAIENAYYSVRDVANNTVVIPFDTTYHSTKLSCDSSTMYFDLWMNSLISGRAYTIDILVIEGGQQQIYRDVGPPFRVVEM